SRAQASGGGGGEAAGPVGSWEGGPPPEMARRTKNGPKRTACAQAYLSASRAKHAPAQVPRGELVRAHHVLHYCGRDVERVPIRLPYNPLHELGFGAHRVVAAGAGSYRLVESSRPERPG